MKKGQEAPRGVGILTALLKHHMHYTYNYSMHLRCLDMHVTSLQQAPEVMRLLDSWC